MNRCLLYVLWAILIVALALTIVGLVRAAIPEESIGGALCRAQRPGGVICRWPGRPWAVGITRHLVIVWRESTKMYVHINTPKAKRCVPLSGGGVTCTGG